MTVSVLAFSAETPDEQVMAPAAYEGTDMNDIFGVPMCPSDPAGVVRRRVLFVTWVAVRRPVIFGLGVRNMPRRMHLTVVVAGLML